MSLISVEDKKKFILDQIWYLLSDREAHSLHHGYHIANSLFCILWPNQWLLVTHLFNWSKCSQRLLGKLSTMLSLLSRRSISEISFDPKIFLHFVVTIKWDELCWIRMKLISGRGRGHNMPRCTSPWWLSWAYCYLEIVGAQLPKGFMNSHFGIKVKSSWMELITGRVTTCKFSLRS